MYGTVGHLLIKAAHDMNAERPEFPTTYQALLETLTVEPEWHSGNIVYRFGEQLS